MRAGVHSSRPQDEIEVVPAAPLRAVPTVRAVEFVRRMRGGSQPHLLRCEDGENYVVKFRNNPQHVRVLANEMLAGRLALLVGLPAAPPAFVDVPQDLIAGNPLLAVEVGARRERCLPGLQFGSRFPGRPGRTLVVDFLPDSLLRRVVNREAAFLGAYVFDKWTCNCDGRQVVFYRKGGSDERAYHAALIDHGFCFNDGDWTFPDSPIRSLYPRRFVYESVRGFSSFDPYLSRIENLEASEIEACVQDIPEEWCGTDRKDLVRLAERLFERRRKLRQALTEAKNSSFRPFPNWK